MIGRAVVLHEQNDKGPAFQPFGDSGGPQAAGVIIEREPSGGPYSEPGAGWPRATTGDDETDSLMCRLAPPTSTAALDTLAADADAGAAGEVSGAVYAHRAPGPGTGEVLVTASIAGLDAGAEYRFAVRNYSYDNAGGTLGGALATEADGTVFSLTPPDATYSRALFDSRIAWAAADTPDAASLGQYAGKVGVLLDAADAVVASCAMGMAATHAPKIDTAGYSATAHLFDAATGARVGEASVFALGDGGGGAVRFVAEVEGFAADGEFALTVTKRGDALDHGGALSDALGTLTVTGGLGTTTGDLAEGVLHLAAAGATHHAVLARGLALVPAGGGAAAAFGAFELGAVRDGAWYNGAAASKNASVDERLVARLSAAYTPLGAAAGAAAGTLVLSSSHHKIDLHMMLEGLTPGASYELVVRNGSSAASLPLADGALYAEAEAFPHAFDADADGGSACFYEGLNEKVKLIELAGKVMSVHDKATGEQVAAAPLVSASAAAAAPTIAAAEAANADCEFNTWSEWSECSVECGVGTHSRHRAILTEATGTGRPCSDSALEQTEGCSKQCYGDLEEGLSPWQVGLITAVFMTVGIVFGLLLLKGRGDEGAGQRSDAEGNFDGMEMSARTVSGGNPMNKPPPAPPRTSTS